MKLLVVFLLFALFTFASAATASQAEADNNAHLAAREALRKSQLPAKFLFDRSINPTVNTELAERQFLVHYAPYCDYVSPGTCTVSFVYWFDSNGGNHVAVYLYDYYCGSEPMGYDGDVPHGTMNLASPLPYLVVSYDQLLPGPPLFWYAGRAYGTESCGQYWTDEQQSNAVVICRFDCSAGGWENGAR